MKLLTVTQCATYLGLHHRTVLKAITRGYLKATWHGSLWLVAEPDLKAFAKRKARED